MRAFESQTKPIAKLRSVIKVMGILRSTPNVVEKKKKDLEDPKEIYLRIRDLPSSDMKKQKDFKNMEIRGAKKCLEIIANFMQSILITPNFENSLHKTFYDYVNKKFGFDNSVYKYYENYLYSFKINIPKDYRIEQF